MSLREVKKSTAAILLLLACLSCDEPDYGNKAQWFVNREAHTLSVVLAKADLKNRWLNAFDVSVLDSLARVDLLRTLLVGMNDDPIATISPDELVKQLTAVQQNLTALTQIKLQIEMLSKIQHNLSTVCESRDYFIRSGLNRLGFVGNLGSIPNVKTDDTIMVYYGDGASGSNSEQLFDKIGDLFVQSENEEQEDKFKAAVAQYPSVVVQGDELFSLSETACAVERTRYLGVFQQIESAVNALNRLWDEKHSDLVFYDRELEVLVLPAQIAQSQTGIGLLQAARQSNRVITEGRIRIDLELERNELAQLEQNTRESCSEVSRAQALDIFRDALTEAKAQLNGMSQFAGDVPEMDVTRRDVDHALSDSRNGVRGEACH